MHKAGIGIHNTIKGFISLGLSEENATKMVNDIIDIFEDKDRSLEKFEDRHKSLERELSKFVTHNDLKTIVSELKMVISQLRIESKDDITKLRTELKDDITKLRTELKDDIADLRIELSGMKLTMKIIIGMSSSILIAVLAPLIKNIFFMS